MLPLISWQCHWSCCISSKVGSKVNHSLLIKGNRLEEVARLTGEGRGNWRSGIPEVETTPWLRKAELPKGKSLSSPPPYPWCGGLLFPESQVPCSSPNVASDTHRANAQTHMWAQWGGNKAKNPTASPGNLCLVVMGCHQKVMGYQGWNSAWKLKYLKLRTCINLKIIFISLGTIGCIG